jgi:hypothetical protein
MVPPLDKIGSGPERSRKHPNPAVVPDNVRYLGRYGKHIFTIFTKSFTAFVESPGGIAPPGAPRTVRDPLESHGSRCSAIA